MTMIEQKSYVVQLAEEERQTWLKFYKMAKELRTLTESCEFLSDSFNRILDEMEDIDSEFMDVNNRYIKF